jgi:class 3 adenylate cyclase
MEYYSPTTRPWEGPIPVTGTELKQRLAAILAADVAGYSRLMAADERATVAALDAALKVFRLHIESNQGRVIDMAGDSVLAVFETATGAVVSALAVQQELNAASSAMAEDQRMCFRNRPDRAFPIPHPSRFLNQFFAVSCHRNR